LGEFLHAVSAQPYGDCAPGRRNIAAMLYYAIVFLLVAVVTAVFGFTNLATEVADVSKLLCFAALIFASLAALDVYTKKTP
jgi:uncharacterized membrane protein YtjA (UPF0391 family)